MGPEPAASTYCTKLSETNYRLQMRPIITHAHINVVCHEFDPGHTALIIVERRAREPGPSGRVMPTEDIKRARRMCFSFFFFFLPPSTFVNAAPPCWSFQQKKGCFNTNRAAGNNESGINLKLSKRIHNFFMYSSRRTNKIHF